MAVLQICTAQLHHSAAGCVADLHPQLLSTVKLPCNMQLKHAWQVCQRCSIARHGCPAGKRILYCSADVQCNPAACLGC